MFKLLGSAFKRLITAITSPFRLLIVKIGRMMNFNVITAKLISPITKKVKSLITIKPQSWKDYYKIGKRYVYKKLFLTIVLIICAGVFILFTMYLPAIPTVPESTEQVVTDVEFMYNDMALKDYEGVANIKSADKRTVYTGDVVKGMATGSGRLYDRAGRLTYVGGFLNNAYEGAGVQYYPISGKLRYEGGFTGGLYSGDGRLYDEDGNLIYTGGFLNGLYEGTGQTYDTEGLLTYEGSFMKGRYHGTGSYYYPNGVAKYVGEFFEGAAQGSGSLYSTAGKLLYEGAMYGGTINYRALMNATLVDVEAMFTETPVVYYANSECVFVYEQAGCALTVNCAVKLYEQSNSSSTQSGGGSSFFFFPDGTVTTGTGTVVMPSTDQSGVVIDNSSSASSSQSAASSSAASSAASSSSSDIVIGGTSVPNFAAMREAPEIAPLGVALPELFAENCAWEVVDSGTNSQSAPASSSAASSSAASSSAAQQSQSTSPPQSGAAVVESPSSSGAGTAPTTAPDFVDTVYTLYYEVDTDVWRSEVELNNDYVDDKGKIKVDSVIVFNGDEPVELEGATEYENTDPPSLGDCAAINFIRNKVPTAFSNIVYETDSRMRQIVEVTGINFAGLIVREAYTTDDLTYLYCYQFGDDTKELMYYVIEG